MSATLTRTLPDDVRTLLAGPNIAHVATLLPDGSPHSVPVWVDVEGDEILIMTGPGSQKARNLERDGRVALSIVDRDQPFTMASVRGRVTRRVEGDAGWVIVDRIAQKYIGSPYGRDVERIVYVIERGS
ncbi:MAG: pyridoxamine 5-phosphate oxidase [Actinomycetia bacterium]|nr:pyridoxamine 5-phosphate oxidase [Actinomycetes bacterium]